MDGEISLFLGGDVMLGRGIDQILPHPGDPTLAEPAVRDAREYIRLAERTHGPLPRPVDPARLLVAELVDLLLLVSSSSLRE